MMTVLTHYEWRVAVITIIIIIAAGILSVLTTGHYYRPGAAVEHVT